MVALVEKSSQVIKIVSAEDQIIDLQKKNTHPMWIETHQRLPLQCVPCHKQCPTISDYLLQHTWRACAKDSLEFSNGNLCPSWLSAHCGYSPRYISHSWWGGWPLGHQKVSHQYPFFMWWTPKFQSCWQKHLN